MQGVQTVPSFNIMLAPLCQGDSGGPLFLAKDLSSSLDDPGTHPWYLIGLVSFGSDT